MDREQKPARQGGNRRRKKVCVFCAEKVEVTGTCAKHQRELTEAIKRARHVALLPFISD